MKTSIDLSSLKTCLKHLQNVIPSNPQLPILSSIYLKLKDEELTLASTDLYLGVKTKTKVDSDVEFEKVVPGDTFKDLISSFSEDEVEIEVGKKEMVIKSNTSQLKVPTQTTEEYPDFPEIEGKKIKLQAEMLEKINDLVSFAASTDQARPVLTTVFLNFKNSKLEVVGTDGFRLAVLSFEDVGIEDDISLLVPVRAFNEVVKILRQSEEEDVILQVSTELKQIKFIVGGVGIFVRLIEGDYPPYSKIIPSQFKTEINMLGEDLKQELQRAFVLAKEASNIVEWKFEDNELVIKSSAPAVGSYEGRVLVSSEKGDGGEIAFNVKYLLEFLSSTKPENLKFMMNESLKPAMFKVEGVENFKYVVMPFRVNE